MDEIITVEEGARLRGVTGETVRRWCREGVLKSARRAGRVWLISKSELLAYEPDPRGPKPKRKAHE
jgi:excisionase family DNA binding protein